MLSTRCSSCRQLINLKNEEVRQAVEETEAAGEKIYVMHCPQCRKPVKIQLAQLKRGLPRHIPSLEQADSQPAPADSGEEPAEQ